AAVAEREANGGGPGTTARQLDTSRPSPSPAGGPRATASTTTTTTTTTSRPAPEAAVAGPGDPSLGIYVGGGNVAAAEQEAAAFPFPYALDYLPGDSWQTIADPSWTLARWAGTSFSMIWGVPMLPSTGGTLAAGAAGDYDQTFYDLGQRLVAAGQGHAILMIGYDPTAPTNPWAVGSLSTARQYVEYWRQIATALRSVPGGAFRLEWDVAAGPAAVPPTALYPGDAYVDIVATDAFDIPAPTAVTDTWSAQAAIADGPNWLARFAARHRKELMIAKWGLVPTADGGRGDDAGFVGQFLTWCARHQVAVAVVWDDGAWGLTGGGFPAAEAAFARLEQSGGHPAGTAGSTAP
ncbi:MAG: glycoside hydrolase family 26 protein, partial [Acidimicrobiales bacterium]